MSHESKIHEAQTSILRELLFVLHAGYAELQKPTGLSSDHFNFHIQRLVDLNLVEKVERGKYRLTHKGKEYANKLDTDERKIERQPKVAVLLAIEREIDGRTEILFQQRTKNPYFGYWGFPSGKIRWGETITETADRELEEETGLSADYRIAGLYHEHTFLEGEDEAVEDKMFFVVHCTNPRGELMEKFEGGINKWMTADEARALEKRYTSFETELDMLLGNRPELFVEEIHRYTKDEF
ncbi:MAG TPA: NUDIX domain-containing protein [Candidatus Saccharimonadales bacterium]|nr:NUDIX domain-containing protein [Candidatus Saccharimonadales bacterium]